MVVYNPANTQRRAGKREHQEEEVEASASPSGACAGVIVPHAAMALPVVLDVKPINAVPPRPPSVVLDVKPTNAVVPRPINAVPPRQPPPAARQLPSSPSAREVPPCLCEHFLSTLGLCPDLPVHFIAEKVMTSTDVDAHQNRFCIPVDGVEHCLHAILTPAELEAANLLHDMAPRPRHKPKKKGKVHGGLRMKVVDLAAGAKEQQMSRWNSSRATVVKGEGYLDFIRWCSFREDDAVEIWAFMQHPVRIFGVDVQYGNNVLHMLIVKKHQPPQRCCYCPIPHAQ